MKNHFFLVSIFLIYFGCDLIPNAVDPPVDEIVISNNLIHKDTLYYNLDSLMSQLNKVIGTPQLLTISDTSKVNIVSVSKNNIIFYGKEQGPSLLKFQVNSDYSKSVLYFDLSVIACPGELDCLGRCNGTALIDNCGVCNGDSDCACPGYPDGTEKDCNGECGGLAYLDECNVCDEDSSNDCVQDCSGNWGGNAVVDGCGYCDDDQSNNCEDANSVLVELFTNVGCSPCVPVNHILDDILHDYDQNITIIRYHWNSPLPIDPMYDYNPADVELRRTMYNILFCPVVLINGVHILNGQSPVENNANSIVLSEIAQESDMYLGHTYDLSASGDSVIVDLEVRPFNTINDVVKIWAVVVEDSIEYAAFNGELIHMQVMRDLNSSAEFSSLIKDEMYTSRISLLKPEGYSNDNPFFYVLSMVQSVQTNKIYQSNRLHSLLPVSH